MSSEQSTSLNEIAAAALSSESANAERKNIRLEGPCGEEVFVMADAKWTTEATANIVSNAVKYSGEGTVITAEVFSNEMFACIRINDQGPGIDPEDIPGIFGRFCRGRGVHDKEGIGVGLYLSRQITEGQGGYIKVSSEPGKGSTFEIYLPVR